MNTKAAAGVAVGLSVAFLCGGAFLAFSVIQGLGAREEHPWSRSAESVRVDLAGVTQVADRSWRTVAGAGARLAGQAGELATAVQASGWG